jgi:hypothetical protein
MATVEFYDGQTATLGTTKDAMQYAIRDCLFCSESERNRENGAVKKIIDNEGDVVWEHEDDDSLIELLIAADFSKKEFNSFVAMAHKEAGK